MDGNSSQEYPVNAELPQDSILGPTFFLLYNNHFPDDVICNTAVYADDTTLYSKCDQPFDLWQQLELSFELESDLGDTVDWGRKWFVDFNAGKLNSFHLTGLINNTCAGVDILNRILALTLSLLLKVPPRKSFYLIMLRHQKI